MKVLNLEHLWVSTILATLVGVLIVVTTQNYFISCTVAIFMFVLSNIQLTLHDLYVKMCEKE